MANKTLLQKALESEQMARGNEKITDEEIELAFAWLDGKVGGKQIKHAIGKSGEYNFLATRLREARRRGLI
jgi:hypothetical protein